MAKLEGLQDDDLVAIKERIHKQLDKDYAEAKKNRRYYLEDKNFYMVDMCQDKMSYISELHNWLSRVDLLSDEEE